MDAHERRALPEGWEWKRLGDVAKYINGRAFKPTEWSNIGKPIIRIQNLTDESNSFNYFDGECELEYCITNGDILISWSASLGVFVWNRGDSVLNQHIFKAILNEKIIDKRFFVFVIRTVMEDMERKTHGSTMKHIVKSEFNNMKIPLPPLPTQRRIVSILEKAEETKRLRAQADELMERLLQSVFLEMFGDSARNPNGWATEKLGEVLSEDPQNGLYKPSTDYGGGTPILRIDSFYDGRITNIERLKHLRCTKEEIEKFKLKVGDIMINRVNSLEYLGKCGLVQNLFEDTVYESNMMRIRPRKDILNSTYLTAFLCTKYIKNQILSRAKKAVNQASINQGDVTSLPILLPPLPLQQKFARIVEKIESMRQSQNQSKQQIEDLFSALMQKAFRGELEAEDTSHHGKEYITRTQK